MKFETLARSTRAGDRTPNRSGDDANLSDVDICPGRRWRGRDGYEYSRTENFPPALRWSNALPRLEDNASGARVPRPGDGGNGYAAPRLLNSGDHVVAGNDVVRRDLPPVRQGAAQVRTFNFTFVDSTHPEERGRGNDDPDKDGLA